MKEKHVVPSGNRTHASPDVELVPFRALEAMKHTSVYLEKNVFGEMAERMILLTLQSGQVASMVVSMV